MRPNFNRPRVMRSDWRSVYVPTFQRAMQAASASHFYNRYMDADDHRFIESIRETGRVSCGSLVEFAATPASSFDYARPAVLPEELEFWVFPYSVDRANPPRPGPYRPVPIVPNPKDAKLALQRKNDLILMKAEKARIQAEYEAKQAAWAEERQRRLLQTMIDDAEWERAAPPVEPPKYFQPVKSRFYVPEWKQIEQREREQARLRARAARTICEKARWTGRTYDSAEIALAESTRTREQIEQGAEERARLYAEQEAEKRRLAYEAARQRAEQQRLARERREAEERVLAIMQAKREQAIMQAKWEQAKREQAKADAEWFVEQQRREREARARPARLKVTPPHHLGDPLDCIFDDAWREQIKARIVQIMKDGNWFKVSDLMVSCGCPSNTQFMRCCDELYYDGLITHYPYA